MQAKSAKDAAEGLTFMREMSKFNSLSDTENGVMAAGVKINDKIFPAGPGHFGKDLTGPALYSGKPVFVTPVDACATIENSKEVAGKFAIAKRGECTFAQKVRFMQEAGAKFAIIMDNVKDSSHETTALFAMSGDGKDDIEIPAVFLFSREAMYLTDALNQDPELIVTVGDLRSLKQQFEGGCDNGNCEPVTDAPTLPSDRESFDHLKKVLSQLVAQFELSLSSEDSAQKTCSEEPQDLFVSKDNEFVNEDVHSSKVCTNDCDEEEQISETNDAYTAQPAQNKFGDI